MLNGEVIQKYKFVTHIGKLTSFKSQKPNGKKTTEEKKLTAKIAVKDFLEIDENSRLTSEKRNHNKTETKKIT